jgi:hypothetical protein
MRQKESNRALPHQNLPLSPAPELMREVVILEESLSKVMGTCLLEEEKGRFS